MPNGWRGRMAWAALAVAGLLASGCSSSLAGIASGAGGSTDGTIIAVGAESQYADVIQQVGGKYVQVSATKSAGPADFSLLKNLA